jgi:type II secretory pathway component GspD/PulD (secretin)
MPVLLCALLAPATTSAAQAPVAPAGGQAPSPAAPPAKRLFDLDADGEDAVALLKRVAADAKVSLSFVGTPAGKASVNLRQATIEQAIALITRSASLGYRRDGDTFVIGAPADLAAAATASAAATGGVLERVYQCRHVDSATLVASLQGIFDPQQLKISVGPRFLSPELASGTVEDVATVTEGSSQNVAVLAEADPTLRTHDVLLSGPPDLVERALVMAQRLDRERSQVKISVRVTDISLDAIREFGIRYNYSSFRINENATDRYRGSNNGPAVPGFKFGTFNHDPVFLEATLSALETRNQARLLASPTMSLLDGERGFLLIGQRLTFPILVANSPGGVQAFDKQEVRVGIYLQVAVAQVSREEGDLVLSIYPQVSLVTGFLSVNGGSYPQIDTREQQTTIRARDRQTIVIGGLIQDNEINNVERIPILGRIPLLGELFTYRRKQRTRSELVILLTPEIERPGDAVAAPQGQRTPPQPTAPPQGQKP